MADDDTEYRFVRRKRARDTDRQTPRALAVGSEQFGRGVPEAVLTEIARMRPRDEVVIATFGGASFGLEYRDGEVTIVLPDGSRVTGSVEEAQNLASLLVGLAATRR